ncbi:acyltransferase [Halobaculum sp. WSA2]|uniref:Acyltransferase n=1 Tax=Halobaculum saliterrae TaxID=2073113 RepID=A0A6B0STQ1_9EURY|nr:acyltransferase [Halobaculum saliterrae]MXR40041.1 acyltransferase [Halobaculum saliterrae]
MTKRHVSLPAEADEGVTAFIEQVDARLSSDEDTCEVVRETLVDLFGDRDAYERWQAGGDVTPAERVRLQGYDPCNATLESEYYAEKDEDRYTRSKHLQWLWRQFDATPMADNIAFALRFRQMLANHLFADAGDDLRLFKGITFTYGHNIEIGDNTVVHDDVHLDDRGKLTIGDRVSISDSAHVYSHDHDVVDQTHVDNYHTIIDDDARVTYDSMISAGCRVGRNAVVGAKATVQGDVPDHHIAVGSPARSIRVKPGWESVADPVEDKLTNRADERRVEFDLPDDLDVFDEFQRDLTPPDGVDAPDAE